MKFDKDHDLLIVPDVHGRTFWREPVMGGDYAHVVFLGDYTDPYPHEGIDRDTSMKIFCEIADFAEMHKDKVTLLLGNHDMHYVSGVFDDQARGSRYSMWSKRSFSAIYNLHRHLFSLAFEADYDTISHKMGELAHELPFLRRYPVFSLINSYLFLGRSIFFISIWRM